MWQWRVLAMQPRGVLALVRKSLRVEQALLFATVGALSLSLPPVAHAGMSVQSATNPSNGHVYHLVTADDGVSGVTWTEAESTARGLGAHLATINSAAENAWITSTFTAPYLWIGLNDAASEGNFVWSSGKPVVYTNWHPGEPSNSGGEEDYVGIYNFDSGRREWNDWKDRTTYMQWPFYGVAEVVPPPPPPKMYAVLVGYADPASEKWLQRTRGDEDAIAMYNVLSKYPGVRPENLWLLINPSTSQDVQTIVENVVTQLRPGDSLLFYYAGHGFTNDGFLNVTNDEPPVPFGSVARLYGSGEWNRGDEYLWLRGGGDADISDDLLSGWLSSDAKMADVRKVVILDSCFAGGFWGTSGNDSDTGDLDKLNNIGLLAACGEGGLSYTVPGTGRGLFSLAVAEALELTLSGFPRADINSDGAVSFDELRYTVGLLYNDQHEGEAGLIRDFPWLEEPIESPIEGLGLYSLNSADYDTNAPIIPEPATLSLLAIGGWALLNRRRFTS